MERDICLSALGNLCLIGVTPRIPHHVHGPTECTICPNPDNYTSTTTNMEQALAELRISKRPAEKYELVRTTLS
jgi:hypothetical protein